MATATAVAAPVAAAAASVKKAPKQLPAPNSDFYQLVDVFAAEKKAIVKKVRTYMETKVQPVINKYRSDDAPALGEHNEEVLRQLGASARDIDGLRASVPLRVQRNARRNLLRMLDA
jgi:crotonobetainyl-CoA:carnitine CoA-transferase CaiB-like acyl-CoA transferase